MAAVICCRTPRKGDAAWAAPSMPALTLLVGLMLLTNTTSPTTSPAAEQCRSHSRDRFPPPPLHAAACRSRRRQHAWGLGFLGAVVAQSVTSGSPTPRSTEQNATLPHSPPTPASVVPMVTGDSDRLVVPSGGCAELCTIRNSDAAGRCAVATGASEGDTCALCPGSSQAAPTIQDITKGVATARIMCDSQWGVAAGGSNSGDVVSAPSTRNPSGASVGSSSRSLVVGDGGSVTLSIGASLHLFVLSTAAIVNAFPATTPLFPRRAGDGAQGETDAAAWFLSRTSFTVTLSSTATALLLAHRLGGESLVVTGGAADGSGSTIVAQLLGPSRPGQVAAMSLSSPHPMTVTDALFTAVVDAMPPPSTARSTAAAAGAALSLSSSVASATTTAAEGATKTPAIFAAATTTTAPSDDSSASASMALSQTPVWYTVSLSCVSSSQALDGTGPSPLGCVFRWDLSAELTFVANVSAAASPTSPPAGGDAQQSLAPSSGPSASPNNDVVWYVLGGLLAAVLLAGIALAVCYRLHRRDRHEQQVSRAVKEELSSSSAQSRRRSSMVLADVQHFVDELEIARGPLPNETALHSRRRSAIGLPMEERRLSLTTPPQAPPALLRSSAEARGSSSSGSGDRAEVRSIAPGGNNDSGDAHHHGLSVARGGGGQGSAVAARYLLSPSRLGDDDDEVPGREVSATREAAFPADDITAPQPSLPPP